MDYSAIITALDSGKIITGIGGIAGAIALVYASIFGFKKVLSFINGR